MIAVIVQSAMHRARRRLHPPVTHDVPEVYSKRLASALIWLVVAFVLILVTLYPTP